jgi:hypothetical protein
VATKRARQGHAAPGDEQEQQVVDWTAVTGLDRAAPPKKSHASCPVRDGGGTAPSDQLGLQRNGVLSHLQAHKTRGTSL